MIKGHIDIDWLDERELYLTKFVEETNTIWSGGYWKDNNLPVPDYPTDGPIVLQTYDEHAPSWAHKIREMFPNVEHSMVTVNCVKPGRFIGPHTDKFFRLYDFFMRNDLQFKYFITLIESSIIKSIFNLSHNLALSAYSSQKYKLDFKNPVLS